VVVFHFFKINFIGEIDMAVLKNAIKALDPAPDEKKEITLLLSLLSELCEQKVTEFSMEIDHDLRTAGSEENRSVPITEIIAKHKEYRAYVSNDAGKIATDVANAVKKFVAGGSDNIIDGIASLVTTGIEAILGAGQGTQQQMSSYYIVAQGLAFARYDVRVWTRRIEAVGITKQIENAMAIVAYKSSVDIQRVTLNTFLMAYERQLQVMEFTPKQQMEYLDYAEKLYFRLRDAGVRPANTSVGLRGDAPAIGNFRMPGELAGSLWS
jgi:hypothetical protein